MSVHTRLFFEHLRASGRSERVVALEAGLGENTVSRWRKKRQEPSVHNLDAALNVLGYRLTIVPLEDGR